MSVKVTCYEYEQDGTTAAAILKVDADVSDIDESKLTIYEFENRPQSIVTAMRTADAITSFGLQRDATGAYNPAAYALAEAISFAAVHVERYTRNGETVDAPSRQQIEALPEPVVMAYRQRSAVVPDIDQIKKPQPAETPATGAENGTQSESVVENA